MNPLQTHSKNIFLTIKMYHLPHQASKQSDFLGRHTNSLVNHISGHVKYGDICLFHMILTLNTALHASYLSQRYRVFYGR
jgi:hypothetical protein